MKIFKKSAAKLAFDVWDFPGPLEDLTLHEHFIAPQRSIFLLVVDLSLSHEQQRRQLQHWFEVLRALLPAAGSTDRCGYRVQLIASKTDLLSAAALKQQLAQLAMDAGLPDKCTIRCMSSVLATSAKTGAGIAELRRTVQKCAVELLNDMGEDVAVPQCVFGMLDVAGCLHSHGPFPS